jgi:prephenate dehydrogenase
VSLPSLSAPVTPSRALIVGAGLMGGSVALALRALGWYVYGADSSAASVTRGIELGAFNELVDLSSLPAPLVVDLSFVAVPVLSVGAVALEVLAKTTGLVTDLGSVKSVVTESVKDPRFIGGHPMAGSEQDGIEGSTASMFQGRTWVLTPTDSTDSNAYAYLHSVIASLGALVVSIPADRHDEIVAVTSHVPHMVAAALMRLATAGAEEHAAFLRLAAGGFRDMTRVAAGHPAIWLDICATNRTAIVDVLDHFSRELSTLRSMVVGSDRPALEQWLIDARVARMNLPVGAPPPEELVEFRIPIPDRPGFIAEVSTLASELGVNIFDIELSHSLESSGGGVLIAIVAKSKADLLRGGLVARKFRVSVASLGER